MEWTQWLFIAIVALLVIAFAVAVWRDPSQFITRIYTNPLVVFGLGAISMIVFAWFAGEHTALGESRLRRRVSAGHPLLHHSGRLCRDVQA